MNKCIIVFLTLLVLLQIMSCTLIFASDTAEVQDGQKSTINPSEKGEKPGFNWTLAFVISSIISLLIAVIIAIKQANKKFPESK